MEAKNHAAFDSAGRFVRPESNFRNQISSQPGSEYTPERNRYHLYVSYACPWAHRALIVRKLKGLEDIISFSSVHFRWPMTTGWRFPTADENLSGENVVPDPLHKDVKEMRDLYKMADPGYTGRWTVPVLWDKKTESIVNNESSEIIRMFNAAFNDLLPKAYSSINLYPAALQSDIDETNKWTYDNINNGVYKSGLAKSQVAYDTAVEALFSHLDRVETHLASSPGPFYFGEQITEVDVRLFVTLIRFDPVYVQHFKCNIRDIRSGYPAIHRWLRKLYWDDSAFHSTTEFKHIKSHYMESHVQINPTAIVSQGPVPHILKKEEEVRVVSNQQAL